MSDQKEFSAELLGRDPKADLAVLKINPGDTVEFYKISKSEYLNWNE